ncbi:hypothetical protein U1Q18_001385, partial [Sarracenia purpurea var. burkii]
VGCCYWLFAAVELLLCPAEGVSFTAGLGGVLFFLVMLRLCLDVFAGFRCSACCPSAEFAVYSTGLRVFLVPLLLNIAFCSFDGYFYLLVAPVAAVCWLSPLAFVVVGVLLPCSPCYCFSGLLGGALQTF